MLRKRLPAISGGAKTLGYSCDENLCNVRIRQLEIIAKILFYLSIFENYKTQIWAQIETSRLWSTMMKSIKYHLYTLELEPRLPTQVAPTLDLSEDSPGVALRTDAP